MKRLAGIAALLSGLLAPPDAMALAIARLARPAAPLVLACDRFADATAAARWLDAPVCRL